MSDGLDAEAVGAVGEETHFDGEAVGVVDDGHGIFTVFDHGSGGGGCSDEMDHEFDLVDAVEPDSAVGAVPVTGTAGAEEA
jgi:hypothetical protein